MVSSPDLVLHLHYDIDVQMTRDFGRFLFVIIDTRPRCRGAMRVAATGTTDIGNAGHGRLIRVQADWRSSVMSSAGESSSAQCTSGVGSSTVKASSAL